jgi:uncharacterized membrane protein
MFTDIIPYITIAIALATWYYTRKVVIQNTNAIEEQKKAIEEHEKSRMVLFFANILGLLQTHTVKMIE